SARALRHTPFPYRPCPAGHSKGSDQPAWCRAAGPRSQRVHLTIPGRTAGSHRPILAAASGCALTRARAGDAKRQAMPSRQGALGLLNTDCLPPEVGWVAGPALEPAQARRALVRALFPVPARVRVPAAEWAWASERPAWA